MKMLTNAVRCGDCGTTGGASQGNTHIPSRARGLCSDCYARHHKRGTLWRYPLAGRLSPYLHPAWQAKRWREEAIALRVARHESVGMVSAVPLTEGEDNTETRIDNAERCGAAWLLAHPTQEADWPDSRNAAFLAIH